MKVTLYGEIRFAKNFDYDDLHVHYHLELPRSKKQGQHQQTQIHIFRLIFVKFYSICAVELRLACGRVSATRWLHTYGTYKK